MINFGVIIKIQQNIMYEKKIIFGILAHGLAKMINNLKVSLMIQQLDVMKL